MVRPLKLGIDYFPMDTDMDQDDKIQMIEAKYPEKGFEIITKLFMKIYKEGYFYKWGEKEQLLFTNKIPNVDTEYINAVINDAVKWDLFNKDLFDQFNILTSNGIQKRFLEAIKRRKEVEIISDYWINVNDNGINDNIILKKVDRGTHTIINQSILKQTITDEIKNEENFYNIELPFKDELFKEVLYKFCLHRINIHKRFEINSLELFLKELKRIAVDSRHAIELMEKSIVHNWPGVYEQKQGKTTSKEPPPTISAFKRFGITACPEGHEVQYLRVTSESKKHVDYFCKLCNKEYKPEVK